MSISQPLPHDAVAPHPVGKGDNDEQRSAEIAVGSVKGEGWVIPPATGCLELDGHGSASDSARSLVHNLL